MDLATQLGDAYRYTLEDQGVVIEPVAAALEQITETEVVGVSQGSSAGVGSLRFVPDPPRFAWRDAADTTAGPLVPIEGSGRQELALPSGSYADIQGDDGRRIVVRVDPAGLPPRETVEDVHIRFKERHCLGYVVRNIRLVDTLPVEDEPQGGINNLLFYFSEAAEGRLSAPGPFRLAQIRVRYEPPDFRDPDEVVLEVADEEFVGPRVGLY